MNGINILVPVRGFKAPASIGTPEALTSSKMLVQSVCIWAQRTGRVANTDAVYIDKESSNNTQAGELSPGSFINLTAPPGCAIDLNELYVDSKVVGDGIFFLGYAYPQFPNA